MLLRSWVDRNLRADTVVGQLLTKVNTHLPLVVLVRWCVVVGVLLRFLVTHDLYSGLRLQLWVLGLVGFCVYTSVLTYQVIKRPSLRDSSQWYLLQAVGDTLIVTILYGLSGLVHSDLFLLYFLPLFTAADYLKVVGILGLFAAVSLALVSVVVGLSLPIRSPASLIEVLVRDVLPRWVFFLFVLLLFLARDGVRRAQNEELEAIYETTIKVARNEALPLRLRAIMDAAIGLLDAKGCKVYLRVQDQELLRLAAIQGLESDVLRPGHILRFGEGIAGTVAERRQPIRESDYPTSPYRVPELGALFEAVVEVPLLFGEELTGVLAVFDDAEHRTFSDNDVEVLLRLAQYAASAIHNSWLLDQVQRQTQALQAMNAAGEAINLDLDSEHTLDAVARHAWNLAGLYTEKPPLCTSVGLLDAYGQKLEFHAAYPDDCLGQLGSCPTIVNLDSGHTGVFDRAIRTGRSQLVEDLATEGDYLDCSRDARSLLVVPLGGRSHILGVISIRHAEPRALSADLRKHVELLATQASTAIENAQLFQQIESLHRASASINLLDTPQLVATRILQELSKVIPLDRATLQRIEGDRRYQLARFNLDDEDVAEHLVRAISDDALLQEVLEYRGVYVLDSPADHPAWESLDTTSDIESWIAIPLIYGDNPIGLITIDQLEAKVHYNQEHRRLLRLFASHATSVLQNAILFHENLERVQELEQTREQLETLLGHLQDQHDLWQIGFVYGESIHYARNKLGLAKTLADDISRGMYGDVPREARAAMYDIIDYVNDYLSVLNDMQTRVLKEPQWLNIHAVLDEAVRMKRVERRHMVDRDYHATNSAVFAPEQQLRQVFLVIMDNALDAMKSKKGRLGIRTEAVKRDGGDFVLVSIADTGKGIRVDEQKTLFESRVASISRRGHRSTGMGLVWARSFMRAIGGDISYDTSLGKGTTMHVLVPQDFRNTDPGPIQQIRHDLPGGRSSQG